MAEPPLLNPPIDPSDPSPFGPNLFPDDDDLAGAELPLPPGFAADLPFDDDFDLSFDFSVDDFSVDDFLELPPEAEHPPIPNPNEGSGPGSGSGITSSGDPHSSDVSRNSCPPSPDSGHSATAAPTDSGRCSAAFPVTQEVKQEERNNWGLKRKKDEQDICTNSYPNRNPKPRGTKFRRSEEANSNSSCVFAAGGEEDEKRRARLMRNRESAQLSRQRKKHYVEELEDKVRALHSKINELNATVSYITAENISLKQQLGGGAGGNGPPSAVYPPAHPMGPVRFPWIPGYAMMPQGSHVPLVPIPRLKPQQPASAPKAKKPESKKSESKTKKVASISLLGFLFLVLLFGGVSPGVNLKYGGFGGGISGQPRGTVLNVSGRGNGLNGTDEFVLCGGNMGFGEGGTQRIPGRKCQTGTMGLEGKHAHNSSESLPAFLYVPRNGKHVKINGNLIIHSVLASEKAMAQKSARDQMRQSAGKEGKETSIAVAHNIASALAVSSAGREVDRHPNSYRKSEQQRALASSDSEDSYRDNLKASLTDGPLQQWFREGMTDPVLSSGICTEVFQFDASPASAHPGGIIPAASFFNATSVNATKEAPPAAQPRRIKNRRILYPEAIPLPGTTLNNSKPFGNPSESSNFRDNKSVSSMVVSVLADPREAGDGDGDARVSPKSFSRIFVVVLIDSVKYVTYSCVLPFKNSAAHLVS